MADPIQANYPLRVTTALGPDAVLLTGFSGQEGLSRLFNFRLDLVAPADAPIDFAGILGKAAVVEIGLPGETPRYFHGLINQFGQGHRDNRYVHYWAEMVPQFWLWTKRVRSRIFQHVDVKQIILATLDGLTVTADLVGTYYPRDYCVQYRESDFAFACRLMEEEGICYYFAHAEDGHELILTDRPEGHRDIPLDRTLRFDPAEAGVRQEERVRRWSKVQELRSGKVTLRDHCFELPNQSLEATRKIPDAVPVGNVAHQLVLDGTSELEVYDYPGGYAGRFDGVDPGGGDRAADLRRIFDDNQRTARIRVEQEAATAVRITGTGTCAQMTAGHGFALDGHFDADGGYVLTEVRHAARVGENFSSGGGGVGMEYENQFECIPEAVPYRPQTTTPRPTVKGTQTAVVVGPPGEEIFTDKYSRVKVQFHWDREGKHDPDSSCWIRVASIWAGKNWGMVNIPRVGQEVVVDFLEGDPDQPIVIGSVYNAENMPPGGLPDARMVSGLKSSTYPGGAGYNGMVFDDTKGKQQVTVHGQYNMTTTVLNDQKLEVKNNRSTTIKGTQTDTITKDTTVTIETGHYVHHVNTGTADFYVKADVSQKYDASQTTKVAADQKTTVGNTIEVTAVKGYIHMKATTEIQLLVGASKLLMKSDGSIELSGNNIAINGKAQVNVHGGDVLSTADGNHLISGGLVKSAAGGANTVKGATVLLNPCG